MKADPKILRIWKRLMYRAFHSRGPEHWVEAQAAGVSLRLLSNSPIAEAVYANAFERLQRSALDRLIQPGDYVIDVGANVGFYTCLFGKRVGATGKVVAIEPTPATFEALQENIRRNGIVGNVECLRVALGAASGNATLHIYPPSQSVYNSFGSQQSYGATAVDTVDVPVVTLDSLFEGVPLQRRAFVKVDVEGFQQQVVQGGLKCLKSRPNLGMMIELEEGTSADCGSSVNETLSSLIGCGFHPFVPTQHGKLEAYDHKNAKLGEGKSLDVFFLKEAVV